MKYVLRYAKRHFSGQSDVEQWKLKPVALAVMELHWSEGIISYSVENYIFLN